MGGGSSSWEGVVVLAAALLLGCLPLLTAGQCMGGRFGTKCQHYCHCDQESPCDVITGMCPLRCAEGYTGPTCQAWNAALGGRIKGDTLRLAKFAFDGRPSTCMRQRDSSYTVQLETRAPLDRIKVLGMIYFLFDSKPENAEAMNVTAGETQCKTSFGGTKSMSEVSVSCPGVVGDSFTFRFTDGFYVVTRLCEIEVLVCTNGFFGPYCHQECGRCRDGVSCEHVSGNCTHGCSPGYEGVQCFDPCSNGTFGQDCASDCGMCAQNATCHHVTGTCAEGCAPGWRGRKCDERCGWGTFGQDCEEECPDCEESMCHHVTGQCLAVVEEAEEEEGTGEADDVPEAPLPREVKERAPLVHGPSLGGGVLLAVLLGLLLVGGVCFLRRRAASQRPPAAYSSSILARLRPSVSSSMPNTLAPNLPPPPGSRPPELLHNPHYETPVFNASSQLQGSYDSLAPRVPGGESGGGGSAGHYEGPISPEGANVYEELPERQPKTEGSMESIREEAVEEN